MALLTYRGELVVYRSLLRGEHGRRKGPGVGTHQDLLRLILPEEHKCIHGESALSVGCPVRRAAGKDDSCMTAPSL